MVSDLFTVFPDYFIDHSAIHLVILNGNVVDHYEDGVPVTIPGIGFLYGGISFYSYQGINTKRVPVHEIGHNFGLRHVISDVENAVRLSFMGGFNADAAGDRLIDTPACKAWNRTEFNSDGVYEGEEIDNNTFLPSTDDNRKYRIFAPKIYNAMYVYDGQDLFDSAVTLEQIVRMHYVIQTDISNGSRALFDAEVPFEELYKPFETVLVPGTVANITDNNDGTANVCYSILQKDRYQKGFDIDFLSEDMASFNSVDYNGLFNSVSYDGLAEIVSGVRNYYTRLHEISTDIYQKIQVPCYRGFICQTEAYISGKLYSTQVLGSMNITVKELSEIEFKDPDLYNKLIEQYYYILKKYTSSGALDQKVFYKP